MLVDLAIDNKDLKFFVVPTRKVDLWLNADYRKWVEAPGKYGQAHDPTNKKRTLDQDEHSTDLEPYLNGWEILWRSK